MIATRIVISSADICVCTSREISRRTSPTPDLPDVVRDNPTTRHVAKTLNARESFESENLLLGELRDAQLIQRIRVYAEGHAVQTQVFEVDLLVAD